MKQYKQNTFNFSVIAGTLKGKNISTPNLGVTRPPLSRLRKSILDFLNPYLRGARYLDLFSGTGSYLFEAVSRGATKALGVDCEEKLVDAINAESERLRVQNELHCWCQDVFQAIPKLSARKELFDIVMIAPPQYKGLISQTLSYMNKYSIVAEGGIVLCQHDSSETAKIDFQAMTIAQQRKYGNTTFTILQL